MKSRSELKMGHVLSKSRSLAQFEEKLYVHSRGHSFDPIFMKLYENVIFIKSRPELKMGHRV